jgi:hypothetical protein
MTVYFARTALAIHRIRDEAYDVDRFEKAKIDTATKTRTFVSEFRNPRDYSFNCFGIACAVKGKMGESRSENSLEMQRNTSGPNCSK